MAINTYLLGMRTFGYKTAATGTAFYQTIDPIIGGRLNVTAFGLTVGGQTATKAYFMKPLGRSTIPIAVASGGSTVVFAGDLGIAGNLFATADYVCVKLSDGTFQYTTVNNWWVSNFTCVLTSALTAAVSANAPGWGFGVYGDTGHFQYKLTVGTQNTKDLAGLGIFATDALYDPMIVWMVNASGSQVDSIDYLTVGAINV